MSLLQIDCVLSGLYASVCNIFPLPLRRLLPGWTLVSFGLSSCGCIVIDKGVFTAVCLPLQDVTGRAVAIVIGLVVARLISGNCNYLYNQRVVFKSPSTRRAYLQYWGLVAINVTLSMIATEVISAVLDAKGLAITLVNFCVDVSLFVFSFTIQRLIIFKNRRVG